MILIFLFLGRRSRLHSLIREYLLSSAAVTHIYYHSKLRKSTFIFAFPLPSPLGKVARRAG